MTCGMFCKYVTERAAVSRCVIFVSTCNCGSSKAFGTSAEPLRAFFKKKKKNY